MVQPLTEAKAAVAIMPAPLRIVVAAAVLTAGIACAALFRRDQRDLPRPTSSPTAETTSGTVELGPINSPQAMEQLAVGRQSNAASPSPSMLRPSGGKGADGAVPAPLATRPAQPEASRRTDSPTSLPSSRTAAPSIPSMAPTFPGAGNLRPSRVGDLPPTWSRRSDHRVHQVADGDTLESIAERYFGSALHADDIRRANSEALSNPRVLPIGIELVIPNLTDGKPATGDAALWSAPNRAQTLDPGNLSPGDRGAAGAQESDVDRSTKAMPKPAAESTDRSAAIAWPSSDRREKMDTPSSADGWEPAER